MGAACKPRSGPNPNKRASRSEANQRPVVAPLRKAPIGLRGRIGALALAGLVAAVGLVDDVEPPAAPDHAIVAMAIAERSQRILDLHGNPSIFGRKNAGAALTMRPP